MYLLSVYIDENNSDRNVAVLYKIEPMKDTSDEFPYYKILKYVKVYPREEIFDKVLRGTFLSRYCPTLYPNGDCIIMYDDDSDLLIDADDDDSAKLCVELNRSQYLDGIEIG